MLATAEGTEVYAGSVTTLTATFEHKVSINESFPSL